MKCVTLFVLFSGIIGFAQDANSLHDTIQYVVRKPIKHHRDDWLSQDKFIHFSACASIVGLSYHTLACRLGKDENQSKVYSVSLTALVSVGKEIYDKKKKGYFSWKDLCWDGAGLLMGYFAFLHDY